MKLIFTPEDMKRHLAATKGWNPANIETKWAQFWSFLKYPTAGQNEFNFFTLGQESASTGTNRQLVNLPQGGKLRNPFLLHALFCTYFIDDPEADGFAGEDADTLLSDIVAGIFAAGVLEFGINGNRLCEIPHPFHYAAPPAGEPEIHVAGIKTLTLAEGTPNTLSSLVSTPPWGKLGADEGGLFQFTPPEPLDEGTSFNAKLSYPGDSVDSKLAVIASDVANDSTNPLYVGVVLEGYEFRLRS